MDRADWYSRWGLNPRPRDYEVGANGLAVSDSSEFHLNCCPVVSDSSGGVGLVCGMKRGILSKGNDG